METSFIVILLLNENQTSSKGSGNLGWLEIKRTKFATKGSFPQEQIELYYFRFFK